MIFSKWFERWTQLYYSWGDNERDNNIEIYIYIGMTVTAYKDKYIDLKQSFDDTKHKNHTEPSKHVWTLKLDKKQFSINYVSKVFSSFLAS